MGPLEIRIAPELSDAKSSRSPRNKLHLSYATLSLLLNNHIVETVSVIFQQQTNPDLFKVGVVRLPRTLHFSAFCIHWWSVVYIAYITWKLIIFLVCKRNRVGARAGALVFIKFNGSLGVINIWVNKDVGQFVEWGRECVSSTMFSVAKETDKNGDVIDKEPLSRPTGGDLWPGRGITRCVLCVPNWNFPMKKFQRWR